MAEERPAPQEPAPAAPGAPAAATGATSGATAAPPRPAFSRKGLIILAGVVVLEAGAFLAVLAGRGSGKAEASGEEEAPAKDSHAARKKDVEEFLKVGRAILDVGEIKVPITSTQPRAPRSVTATIHVVVSSELLEKLQGGGGGHGGGGKSNPQKDVLVLNIRSILRGMMDQDGIRLIEPSAKTDLERRARERLNHAHVEGDEEKAQVVKVLRGQVLQVIVDKFDAQSY